MDDDEAKYSLTLEQESCDKHEQHDIHSSGEDKKEVLIVKITSEFTQIGRSSSVSLGKVYQEHSDRFISHDGSTTESENSSLVKKPRKKTRKTKIQSDTKSLVTSPPCKNIQPAQPSKLYLELDETSNDIRVQIKKLRDNGRWDLFEETAVMLSRKYTSFEAQIVLSLERGLAACYNNRLPEAKKRIKAAIQDASGLETSDVLVGRGLYYLSAVYRRENKTGKAIDCTELAEQNFSSKGVMTDRCSLTYERASALMDFILQCADPRQAIIERVMSLLKRSIDECLILINDDSYTGYLKTHHFALMKMPMLLLDCRTTAGRKRSVPQKNIQEAEKYLATLEKSYWHKTSRGEKVQCYFGQADLHFRKQQYQAAQEFAQKALDMAESFGFNTEIKLAKDRLEDIHSAWYQHRVSLELRDSDDNERPSESHAADVSESTDSDWLLKPSLI